jgi:hypothetical protein
MREPGTILLKNFAGITVMAEKGDHTGFRNTIAFNSQNPVAIFEVEINGAKRKMFNQPLNQQFAFFGALNICFEDFNHFITDLCAACGS